MSAPPATGSPPGSSTPAALSSWVDDSSAPLLTDLYQLTMIQAYWHERMTGEAVFSLFVRRLPETRNYLIACGLEEALRYLERLRFDRPVLDFLAGRPELRSGFIDWLSRFRFTGDVYAVPEGTPIFANEPMLEVAAPIAEAQLAESFLMNQMHHQTVAASKAARVVTAAQGRRVVDFGMRRMHGADAAVKAARAFHVAGVDATSNVLAGAVYGLPIAGTMAHSYVQAHDDERAAFRSFVELYPETILLVDTYDTLGGVHTVVELAAELEDRFAVRAVRLDSGDLVELAFAARRRLDAAGLEQVEIFASGGLDEYEVERIVAAGAPITGFGVGTAMGVSADVPSLDLAYKLTSYAGRGRIKTAPGKPILPGRKQVFRLEEGGRAVRDLLARHDEQRPGRPLLRKVMERGRRLPAGRVELETSRAYAKRELACLPDELRSLRPPPIPYPVEVTAALERDHEQAISRTLSSPT